MCYSHLLLINSVSHSEIECNKKKNSVIAKKLTGNLLFSSILILQNKNLQFNNPNLHNIKNCAHSLFLNFWFYCQIQLFRFRQPKNLLRNLKSVQWHFQIKKQTNTLKTLKFKDKKKSIYQFSKIGSDQILSGLCNTFFLQYTSNIIQMPDSEH